MFNRIAAMTAIILGMTISIFGQNTTLKGEVGKAMSYFQNIGDRDFEDHLRRIRLPEVSVDHRAEVLASLSDSKEARVSRRNRLKLDAILPILRFHNRENSVVIKVIQFDHPFVALQGRVVLLISVIALNLLSVEELQAMVAHEIAHDYFWWDYFNAKHRGQYNTMFSGISRDWFLMAAAYYQLQCGRLEAQSEAHWQTDIFLMALSRDSD